MPSLSDFTARGKVTSMRDGSIMFQPAGTNYELQLAPAGGKYDGPMNTQIDCVIRGSVRKLWTVPSGGNFVSPIFGTPRIVQGRVRHVEERAIVVQAGAPFLLELPAANSALDMNSGPIGVGSLVNAVVLPGATFELAGATMVAR